MLKSGGKAKTCWRLAVFIAAIMPCLVWALPNGAFAETIENHNRTIPAGITYGYGGEAIAYGTEDWVWQFPLPIRVNEAQATTRNNTANINNAVTVTAPIFGGHSIANAATDSSATTVATAIATNNAVNINGTVTGNIYGGGLIANGGATGYDAFTGNTLNLYDNGKSSIKEAANFQTINFGYSGKVKTLNL